VVEVDAVYDRLNDNDSHFHPPTWQRALTTTLQHVNTTLHQWTQSPSSQQRYLLVDDTHYYRSMRRRYAALAASTGVSFVTVFVQRPLDDARASNAARGAQRRVPSDVFDSLVAKFEVPSQPWEHCLSADEALALGVDGLAAAFPPTRCTVDEADALAAARHTSYLSKVHDVDVALRRAVAAAIAATDTVGRPEVARACVDIKRRLLDQVRLGLFDNEDKVCDAVIASFNEEVGHGNDAKKLG